ncbi:MAG: hypothetical protein IH606_24225 [Burkholderiales bacterium]|nr:hypothetical protein [Burkholderiales bacterium]
MPRFLKTLVLYLSMLLIPLQGYAASTTLHCGLAHQHTQWAQETAHASAHAHAKNADHRHQGVAALSPESIAYAQFGAEPAFTAGDRGLATGGVADVHNGSEHAACPVGTAVPASTLRFQPAEQNIERAARNHFPNIAFITDAPARPPRSLLA